MSNSFPVFSDGNVEIRFSENDKFVLHSWQLALHSPWFKASLSDRWNSNNNSSAADGKNYWIYELRFDKDSNIGTLVRAQTDGSASTKSTELLASCSQIDIDSDSECSSEMTPLPTESRAIIAKGHQDLFRCLYHVSPELSGDIDASFSEMVQPIRQLYEAAKFYGCEDIVRDKIDSKLRKVEDEIQYDCKSNTVSMLDFSITIKSEWIFKEAAIHLSGRSNRHFQQVLYRVSTLGLEDSMRDLRKMVLDKLKEAELRMFRIPVNAGTGESTWLAHAALNFFRHWLAEQLQASQGSGMGPGYANVYHTIAKGLFSYKTTAQKQQVRQFMSRSQVAFTEENMTAFEPELKKVFSKAAYYVASIREQCTRYQGSGEDNYRALTCIRPASIKVPWEA